MDIRNCGNCKYFHRPLQALPGMGNDPCCRRYPPAIMLVGQGVLTMFPVVSDKMVCGEHTTKLQVVPGQTEPAL